MVQEAAKKAMEKVAAEFGLTLQTKGGKFLGTTFTPSFSFLTLTDTGIPAEFLTYASMFGMKAEDFGRTFRNGGKVYKVTGLNPRKHKYPIQAQDDSGKIMLFTREGVVAQLRAQDV
jgi:hypothetical protein